MSRTHPPPPAKYGIVRSYNYQNLALRVDLDDGTSVNCRSTEYDSGSPRRDPEVGAQVKVIYNHRGDLLRVYKLTPAEATKRGSDTSPKSRRRRDTSKSQKVPRTIARERTDSEFFTPKHTPAIMRPTECLIGPWSEKWPTQPGVYLFYEQAPMVGLFLCTVSLDLYGQPVRSTESRFLFSSECQGLFARLQYSVTRS